MDDQFDYHDHAVNPRGAGLIPGDASLGAAGGSACGDMLCIGVVVRGGRIAEAGFEATGCAATTAAASAAVGLIEGGSFLDAARVGEHTIDTELGGLRPAMRHAARLAADALHRALGAAAGKDSLADPNPNRCVVAMSGGVDSAVAALLLADAGRDAVGVTLQLWDDPGTDGNASCCSPQAVAQARSLAHELGIPHITLDLREEFRAGVVEPYVDAHRRGSTPNPCVGCNGHVRFEAFDAVRDRLGATHVATGHYARIDRDGRGPLLAAAADEGKDQTYMLAAVPPELLEHIEFPLGPLRKSEVRELARERGLAVAEKPESQDLCFIAGIGRDGFLDRHAGIGERPGAIVDGLGARLGTHPGAHRYTVGQRRGLGVAAPEPLYVLDVDVDSNTVVAGRRGDLETHRVRIVGASLLRWSGEVTHVKLRYRNRPLPCTLAGDAAAGRHRELWLNLARPVDGAAPGQVACLLRGDTVVGWGTIARPRRTEAPAPDGTRPLPQTR